MTSHYDATFLVQKRNDFSTLAKKEAREALSPSVIKGGEKKEVGCSLSRERREKLAFAKKKKKRAVEREVRSCLLWKNKRQTEHEGGKRVKGFGWKQIW